MEPGHYCAYNQSREVFLGQSVVAGDFSAASFQDWLATLRPNSGSGMWMIPFRGISAMQVRTQLDLIYLDADCRVIEVVEFFPTFKVSPSSPTATSVLVLPTHSIAASGTQVGDQLVLCPPEELELRRERLFQAGASLEAPPIEAAKVWRVARREETRTAAQGRVEVPVAAAAPVIVETPAQAEPAEEKPQMKPAGPTSRSPLSWLRSWFSRRPADPRRNSRLPVEGLVAHFFTGGAPQGHAVRDVSPTGLFVITSERWYAGTVVRMTLTKPDRGQAPSDRSITIHARSMRWGNDGVGLEFVVQGPGKAGREEPVFMPVDRRQLAQFLKGVID